MGRELVTALDSLKPNLRQRVEQQQELWRSKEGRRVREFHVGDLVYILGFQREKWRVGKIVGRRGEVNFEVALQDGTKVHRHADQMRIRHGEDTGSRDIPVDEPVGVEEDSFQEMEGTPQTRAYTGVETHSENEPGEGEEEGTTQTSVSNESFPVCPGGEGEPRRSTRAKRPPVRFGEYVK